MLIERRALDTILGTQETTQPSEQGRAGHRVVASVSPNLVMRLSRIVMAVSGSGTLRLERRTVRPEPITLAELRQHPIVRIAYLESLLYDMVEPGKTVPYSKFQEAMEAEGLNQEGAGKFSNGEKLSIIDYLQTVTIPSCEKISGETPDPNIATVKSMLRTLKDKFEQPVRNEQELAKSQSSEDDIFEGSDSGSITSDDEQAYYSTNESLLVVAGEDGNEAVTNGAIQHYLREVYKEHISIEDLEYFRKSLPNADWRSKRLLQELAFFHGCNLCGARIDRKKFARLHNEGLFTDEMLVLAGLTRGEFFPQEMEKLRVIAKKLPKLPKRQESAVSDAKAELTRANIPEEDSNILIAGIKRITRTIVNKLRALYRAMTRTGDNFTAEECTVLINKDIVNEQALNDPSKQSEAMKQLRKALAEHMAAPKQLRQALAEQQEAADQLAHSSSDDTVVNSGGSETQGISSGEISTEEINLEDSETEPYSDWVNSCYSYFSARQDNSGKPLVATREECQLLFGDLQSRYPTPDLLLDKLKYFRNMQFHQNAAQVNFTNSMFSALVLNGHLETDPTVIQTDPDLLSQMPTASNTDVIVHSRNKALLNIASALQNTHNFKPDNTDD